VTPYIWKGERGFSTVLLSCPNALPRVRLTVDEPIDLQLINELYARVDAGAMHWTSLLQWILDNRCNLPANLAVVRDAAGAVLLEQRPAAGIWGGLWVCPQFDDEAARDAWLERQFVTTDTGYELPIIEHAFTHFDLQLRSRCVNAAPKAHVADKTGTCWYDPRQPARIGLAKPVLDILRWCEQADGLRMQLKTG